MSIILVALGICRLLAALFLFATLLTVAVRSVLYWLDPTVAHGSGPISRTWHALGLGFHDALRVNNGRAAILFIMALTCTFCLPYVVLTRPSLTGLAVDQAERMQSPPISRPEKLLNMLLHGDASASVNFEKFRSKDEPKPEFYSDWPWWKTFFLLWLVFPVYGILAMREEIAHLWDTATRRIHRQHHAGHAAPGSSWIAQLITRNLPAPQTATTGTGVPPAQPNPPAAGTARVLLWAIVADFAVAFLDRMFRGVHHAA